MTSYEIIPLPSKKTLLALLDKGERKDGRDFNSYRDIEISTNVIKSAEGSAQVKIGNTIALAGVKLILGQPYSDTPDQGIQIVNAELVPLASPSFEPGPPDEDDIELSRVVDRVLRSSNMIDLNKLSIIKGKKVWIVYIDIYILNHDGNLFDASIMASVAALLTAKIPKVEITDENKVRLTEEYINLPIKDLPIGVTFSKIGNNIIVDPCYEEERLSDAMITIGINKENNICTLQKRK
ncbi:MAG TPA: exosome complex protein Rrp42, partial [Thermoprotei archaeon]|nr:exosome complex protein Rrp42 [Thermoprotei archaeon]